MNRAGHGGEKSQPLKILFIDPYAAFVTWSGELSRQGCDWQIIRSDDIHAALELFEQTAFDAIIVASISSFERDLGILRQAGAIRPRTVRILLSAPLSATKLAKALDVTHRSVFQGSAASDIIAAVEQTVTVTQRLYRDKVVRSFAAFRQLPSPPAIYRELNDALNSERASNRDIAGIVERDPALAVRILRLVNSSYFGLGRQVNNLTEALTLLGLRTVRGLALSGHLSAHYPDGGSWTAFSFERMNQRALSVARLAREICKPYGQGSVLMDQAFLAGLLLDIGMLMLAAEQGGGYIKVMRFAARKQLSLCAVEQMAYGVTHAELGAYLLNMWNISPQVVEAVQLHHTPDDSASDSFSPLSAVHIADALLPSVDNEFNLDLSSALSTAHVERIGAQLYLPTWKMQANAYRLRMKAAQEGD